MPDQPTHDHDLQFALTYALWRERKALRSIPRGDAFDYLSPVARRVLAQLRLAGVRVKAGPAAQAHGTHEGGGD